MGVIYPHEPGLWRQRRSQILACVLLCSSSSVHMPSPHGTLQFYQCNTRIEEEALGIPPALSCRDRRGSVGAIVSNKNAAKEVTLYNQCVGSKLDHFGMLFDNA
eukprot:scaffold6319_cov416-Ochromonas_danica.AAC.1